jgi:hypothetical protein
MPETITRNTKVKTAQPEKVLKQVSPVETKPEVNSPVETKTINKRNSVISENKIKKVLDEERVNKDVIVTIKTIKAAMDNNKEVKKELSEKELEVVGEYIDKYKNKLQKEEKDGKKTSTNEIALRAFMDKKYKFKKDLSTYIGIVSDLIVEEIVSSSMEHVVSIDKKLINKSHIVKSQLSDKLLYPLYCNLPSFVKLTESSTESSESTESTTEAEVSELDTKVNKYFMGNIKTIFNNLRGSNENRLKIQKKYQEFLSSLVVEFLDRLVNPLLITVRNNSKNRVIVQNTVITVVEILMGDFSLEQNRYPELQALLHQRWTN